MLVPPRRILLATDLGARSDRAQDRAVSLMKMWDAELVVLHVLEAPHEIGGIARIPFFPYHRPNERRIYKARNQLLASIGEIGSHIEVRIEEGVPHEAITRISEEEECDLVVCGVARNEVLGRFTLGKTVDRLLRKSDRSLLVVTERVLAPYRKIVALADLSEESKRAIEVAANWFPEQSLSVLHAYSAPRSSSVDNIGDYRETMRQVAQRDLVKLLDSADLTLEQRVRISMLVEFGKATTLVRDLLQLSDVGLVVAGLHRRGFLFDAVFDGEAKRIISSLSCDALIVR